MWILIGSSTGWMANDQATSDSVAGFFAVLAILSLPSWAIWYGYFYYVAMGLLSKIGSSLVIVAALFHFSPLVFVFLGIEKIGRKILPYPYETIVCFALLLVVLVDFWIYKQIKIIEGPSNTKLSKLAALCWILFFIPALPTILGIVALKKISAKDSGLHGKTFAWFGIIWNAMFTGTVILSMLG